ncbi:hypothetical protein QM457_07525 [Streptococcus timonensis]|jgi:hypothetical protein
MKQIFIFSDTQKDNISYFEREPAILVSMSRSDLPYLKEQDFANYQAVYVLIGGNKRYVGQAAGQSISLRLSQHFLKEDKAKVTIFEKNIVVDFKSGVRVTVEI